MFSVFTNLKNDATPEQLYQQALEQKALLSQQIEHLIKTRQALINNITQEDHLSMLSQFNIASSMLTALEKNIRELTNGHPHLLTGSQSSGSMTGDHYAGSGRSSSSGSAFSFAYANASQLTFYPGVNTKASAKQDKHTSMSSKRR